MNASKNYSKSAMSNFFYILKWISNPPKRCWLQLKYYVWKGRMIVIFIFYSNEILLTRNDPKQIIWLIYQLIFLKCRHNHIGAILFLSYYPSKKLYIYFCEFYRQYCNPKCDILLMDLTFVSNMRSSELKPKGYQ